MTTNPSPAKPPLKTVVQELLVLIDNFGMLLENETKALRQADYTAVDALQPGKRTMARKYADLATLLAARKAESGTLDTALRKTLVAKRAAFTGILGTNLVALNAAKNSAARLVDRIRELAQKAVIEERQTHYSAQGRTASWKSAAMSLSVDQSL